MHGTGGAGNPEGAHLMVCLGVDRKKNTAVIVPIVTRHELSDPSCILNADDHPFLKHESCAAYDFARLLSLSETEEKIDKGQIKLRDSVSDGVLKRLQVGFVVSDETAPYISSWQRPRPDSLSQAQGTDQLGRFALPARLSVASARFRVSSSE